MESLEREQAATGVPSGTAAAPLPSGRRRISEKTLMAGVMAAVILASALAVWLLLAGGASTTVRIDEPAPRSVAPGQARSPVDGEWTEDPAALAAAELATLAQKLGQGAQPTVSKRARDRSGRDPGKLFPLSNGAFYWGGFRFDTMHYNLQWQLATQLEDLHIDPGYPRRQDGAWEVRGRLDTRGDGPFLYKQRLRRIDDLTMVWEATADSDAGVNGQCLAVNVTLPASWYDGEQLVEDGRPVRLSRGFAMGQHTAQSLQIAVPSGRLVIQGPMQLVIQDNRVYGGHDYSIRFGFNPTEGVIHHAQLKMLLRYIPKPKPPTTRMEVEPTTRPG